MTKNTSEIDNKKSNMPTKQRMLCPHKKTDFRYALWVKERKALVEQAKRNSFKVAPSKNNPVKGAIRVDTSKARTNTPLIRLCLQELGMKEYPNGRREGHCDIHWQGGSYGDNSERQISGGKINKFPGMNQISRKVNLGRCLDTMAKLFPEEYDFHPQSWFLPQQYSEFVDDVRRIREKHAKHKRGPPVYIVKPDDGTQGDGIYLITDPTDYVFSKRSHIVQEYLADPFLIDGLKFDLRIYVVLQSIEPLQIYIYNEGLARFCTKPYEKPTNKNLHEAFMHLTNYSLNKRSDTYEHTANDFDGSKRSMTRVFRKLARRGHDTLAIWDEVKELATKTIIAMIPDLKVQMRAENPPGKPGPSCFQILGFDILLTSNLKPMLLEINSSPSLRVDYENEISAGIREYLHSPLDEEIKRPLVREVLLLNAPKHKIKSMKERLQKRVDRRPILLSASSKSSRKGSTRDSDRVVSASSSASDLPYQEPCTLDRDPNLLTEIYPEELNDKFEELRILERTVEIFLFSLGIKGHLTMGPTMFRNFARRCKLMSNMTGSDFDIMYINLHKRWEHANPEGTTGIGFQGFLEAFMLLADARCHHRKDYLSSLVSTLDHCEAVLHFGPDHKPIIVQQALPGRLTRRQRLTPHDVQKDSANLKSGSLVSLSDAGSESNSNTELQLVKRSSDVYKQVMDSYKTSKERNRENDKREE